MGFLRLENDGFLRLGFLRLRSNANIREFKHSFVISLALFVVIARFLLDL